MFPLLALTFFIFRPQIRIPHQKLYMYVYPPGTLRNQDPERNLVFSYQMHRVYYYVGLDMRGAIKQPYDTYVCI